MYIYSKTSSAFSTDMGVEKINQVPPEGVGDQAAPHRNWYFFLYSILIRVFFCHIGFFLAIFTQYGIYLSFVHHLT